MEQHLAATGPNVEILRDFLSQGASVHLRNREGHTPLFLAANAGLRDHTRLLREAGGHLHADELPTARLDDASEDERQIWALAGALSES
jgi:60kDa lysophospholipase